MAALSCDDAESHKGWINDIKFYTDGKFSYPIIADPKRELAVSLGMVDPDEKDAAGLPLTCRAVSWLSCCFCLYIFFFLKHDFSSNAIFRSSLAKMKPGKVKNVIFLISTR